VGSGVLVGVTEGVEEGKIEKFEQLETNTIVDNKKTTLIFFIFKTHPVALLTKKTT